MRSRARVPMRLAGLLALVLASGCATAPGRLQAERIHSPAMEREMGYEVYLPPDFSPEENLPLVVFLHGGGDEPASFDEAGIGQKIDRALREQRVPRAVIVVPEGGRGFWVNWADGSQRWADWVLQDLLPHAHQTYGTRPCPEGCHLMGVSMGGYGTLHMALTHPKTFATITPISAPIMNTDEMIHFTQNSFLANFVPFERIFGPVERERVRQEDLYVQWTEPADLHGMELMLAWGDADRKAIRQQGARFHQHLLAHDIPHDLLVYPGEHAWASWDAVIVEALQRQVGGG